MLIIFSSHCLPCLLGWNSRQRGPEAAAVTTGTGAFNVIKDRKFKHRPAWSRSFGPVPFISQPYLHVPSSSSFFKHSRCIRVSISLFVFLISLLWASRGRWRREKESKREREREREQTCLYLSQAVHGAAMPSFNNTVWWMDVSHRSKKEWREQWHRKKKVLKREPKWWCFAFFPECLIVRLSLCVSE